MKPKIKLVIFDVMGVVLDGGYPETCKALAKKYNRDWKELYNVFYKKYFNMAAERKITQKQAWVFALKETNLPMSDKDAKKLHYNILKLNKKLVLLARNLKCETLLLSKNTRSQLYDLEIRFSLSKYFKNIINTWEVGLPKASIRTSKYILEKFKVQPEEVIYIDDQEENLAFAKELGINTIFYKNFEEFKKDFEKVYR